MIIAQITDFHVGRRLETPDGVLDTFEQLRRAIEQLNALDPAPDVVLATGDLTNGAKPEDYARLKTAFASLRCPVYVIPGNHDDRARMRATFDDHDYMPGDSEFLHYVIEHHALRLIGLDTVVPGEIGGVMCQDRLAWFGARLAEAPERPTVVFMHHPPFDTGIPFFDRIGCRNGAAMGAVVARHPQIEAVLCGHVHRAISLRWHGTVIHVTPSPAYQYPLQLNDPDNIQPVLEPPAYRLCLWTPGVGLVSHLGFFGG